MESLTKEWIWFEVVDRSSSTNKRETVDAGIEPWGTPALTGNDYSRILLTRTHMTRQLRKRYVHDMRECRFCQETFAPNSANSLRYLAKLGMFPCCCRMKTTDNLRLGQADYPLDDESGIYTWVVQQSPTFEN